MKYNIVTTGKGMLPPGIIVGDVEAKSLEAAVKKIQQMAPDKKFIWDVVPDE